MKFEWFGKCGHCSHFDGVVCLMKDIIPSNPKQLKDVKQCKNFYQKLDWDRLVEREKYDD